MNKPKQPYIIAPPVWFTLRGNVTVGIVVMNDGYQDKSYIGTGHGINEKEDVDFILKTGSPFPIKIGKLLCGVE